MVVREFLEKGRELTERIPYSVIALAALGRFAFHLHKGGGLFHSRRELLPFS